MIFINIADIFYFKTYGVRVNYLALEIFKNFKIVGPMIWKSYPIVLIFLIVSFIIYILSKGIKRLKINIYKSLDRNRWNFILVIIILFLLFSFIYIGPPFWYFSSISEDPVINQASLNGTYTLIKSIQQKGIYHRDIPQYELTDYDTAINNLQEQIRKDSAEEFNNENYPTCRKMNSISNEQRKNIVIILIESFGSEYIGCLNNGNGFSPHFDSLVSKGMLFTNFYSNGPRTQHAIVSTLSSFPAILNSPLIRRKGINEFQTLGNILKKVGYKNIFIYGGDVGFDNMDLFLLNSGFSTLVSEDDFKAYRYKNEWGVCDEDLFDRSLNELKLNENELTFTVILTVSNHAPFDIPPYFKDELPTNDSINDKQATFLYTDYCLSKFMNSCVKSDFYNNTVFYIMADHGEAYSLSDHNYRVFNIPLLIVNSNMGTGKNILLASQIDIGPTILEEIGYNFDYHFIGKSLYSKDNRFVIYQAFNDYVYFINEDYYSLKINPISFETNLYRIQEHKLIPDENTMNQTVMKEEAGYLLQSLSFIYTNGKYRFE